jgi:hypothetical protein
MLPTSSTVSRYVRIEQGERGGLRHRHAERRLRAGLARIQSMGCPRAAQRLPSIDGQEGGMGFGTFATAAKLIAGIETMHMIKKGQLACHQGLVVSDADRFYSLATL